MKNIYFIRHGEGYHNLTSHGHHNYHIKYPRLTMKGIRQCYETRQKLENIEFDLVLVSPLRRTLETATYIFGKHIKTICVEEIREFISNTCDLREPISDVSPPFDHIDFRLINDLWDYNKQENNNDIENRMKKFMKYLIKSSYHNIAVVSHGEFLNRFLKKYSNELNITYKTFMDNCEYKTGILYNWFQIKPINKSQSFLLNCEYDHISINGKTHRWSSMWRKEYLDDIFFKLICRYSGNNNGNKFLHIKDNTLCISNKNKITDIGYWKEEYINNDQYQLGYYQVDYLDKILIGYIRIRDDNSLTICLEKNSVSIWENNMIEIM